MLFSLNNLVQNALLVQMKIDSDISVVEFLQNQLFKDLFQRDDTHAFFSFMMDNCSEVGFIGSENIDRLQQSWPFVDLHDRSNDVPILELLAFR